MKTSSRLRPLIPALTLFLIFLAFGLLYLKNRAQSARAESTQRVGEVARRKSDALTLQLERTLAITYALSGLVKRDNGEIRGFDEIAENLLQTFEGVSNVAILQGGVVRSLYPIPQGPSSLGRNLLEDPVRRDELLKAIESRKLTVAGPMEFIRGGTGIVGRLAVPLKNPDGTETMWVATASIRLDELIEVSDLRLLEKDGYQYELSRLDPHGRRQVISSTLADAPRSATTVTVPVSVPNGRWELKVVDPRQRPFPYLELAAISVLALLAAIMVFLLLRQPEALREHVRIQTAQLEKANAELRRQMGRREKMEGELIRQRNLLERILDTLPIDIFLKDGEGRYLLFNETAATTAGIPREKILGRKDAEIFPPDIVERLRTIDEKVRREGGLHLFEGQLSFKTHPGFFIAGKTIITTDPGNEQYLLGYAVDITERVRAEQEIERQRAFIQSVVDSDPNVIIVKDYEGRFVFVNQTLADLYGKAKEEIIGHNNAEFVSPEEAESFLRVDRQAIDRRERIEVEESLQLASGEQLWFHTIKAPLVQPDGIIHVLGISVNITARREAEVRLRQALHQATEATRAKGQFLANMSHEIRTPMNAVLGNTNLLLETSLNYEQRDFALTIRRSAEGLLDIINDILDFSKIEAGRVELEPVEFDLESCLEDVFDIVTVPARKKGLDLALCISPDCPARVYGDSGRLRQIILNLVSNSVKFTERGEVRIEVSLIGRQGDGTEMLRFEVRDTGIGIPSSKQPLIFESFYQAENSFSRKYGGTGLGLSITRRLAEIMGGRIGLISEDGHGTTFWVELPFARAATTARPDAERRAQLAQKRILVAAESASVREALAKLLGPHAAQLKEAASVDEAREALAAAESAAAPYDYLLADQHLPGGGPRGVLEALRTLPGHATTRTTLITHNSSDENIRISGFHGTLLKPFKPSRVFQVLSGAATESDSAVLVAAEVVAKGANARRRARLLLVEDNLANQKLAVRLLRKGGYTSCDVVANGREAVEMASRFQYDLILMDCQMPEMDGFEATRIIREREGSARHTPIVAMTAHAMSGDRQRCLAAGMDAYLTKPIDAQLFFSTLAAYMSDPRGSDEVDVSAAQVRQAAPDEKPTGPTPPVDLEQLHRLTDGHHEFERDLFRTFLVEAATFIGNMERGWSSSDTVAMRNAAHALKGAAANLGANGLAAISLEIQRAAEKVPPSANEVPILLQRIQAEYSAVQNYIQSVYHLG